jgi:hypothetical protein
VCGKLASNNYQMGQRSVRFMCPIIQIYNTEYRKSEAQCPFADRAGVRDEQSKEWETESGEAGAGTRWTVCATGELFATKMQVVLTKRSRGTGARRVRADRGDHGASIRNLLMMDSDRKGRRFRRFPPSCRKFVYHILFI